MIKRDVGDVIRPWYVGEALKLAGLLKEAFPHKIWKDQLIREIKNQNPIVLASKRDGLATGHTDVISSITKNGLFKRWDSKGPKIDLLTYEQLCYDPNNKNKWVNTFLTGI